MYAGHSHRNVVLKGSDLVVFKSSDEDRANMFDTFREVRTVYFIEYSHKQTNKNSHKTGDIKISGFKHPKADH